MKKRTVRIASCRLHLYMLLRNALCSKGNMVIFYLIVLYVGFGLDIFLSVSHSQEVPGQDPNNNYFLEFVSKKLDTLRAQVKSAVYHMQGEVDIYVSPVGRYYNTFSADVTVADNHISITHFRDRFDPITKSLLRSRGFRIFVNDQYAAVQVNFNSPYHIFEFTHSDHVMPESFSARFSVAKPLDPLLFGFGSGDEMLSDAMALSIDGIRWTHETVLDEGGYPLIEIKRFTAVVEIEGIPDTIFTLDPAKNYMIVKVTANGTDGSKGLVREIELGQHNVGSNQLWLPERIVEYRYKSWTAKEERIYLKGDYFQLRDDDIERITKTHINWNAINIPIDTSEKKLSELNLKNGDRIVYYMEDGESELRVYYEDNILPVDVYKRLVTSAFVNKESSTSPLSESSAESADVFTMETQYNERSTLAKIIVVLVVLATGGIILVSVRKHLSIVSR